jgi:hypothetical protein
MEMVSPVLGLSRRRERRGAAEGGDAERVVALSELVLGMFLFGGVV